MLLSLPVFTVELRKKAENGDLLHRITHGIKLLTETLLEQNR